MEFTMKKILIALAASVAVASPALANEGRIEARGGVVWACDGCQAEDVYGVAAGYDWDLGGKAFAGVEVAGDQISVSGSKVAFSFGGRLGARAGEKGKFYVNGGYQTESFPGFGGDPYAGVGYEQGIGQNLYLKAEYRHVFVDSFDDSNIIAAGVGVKF
jgi:outer membrane immunogenic protein